MLDKIEFTLLLMALYAFARMVPLYGIDLSAVSVRELGEQSVLLHAVNGDMTQSSVMALGIAPSMLAGIIVQVVFLCQKRGSGSKMTDEGKTYLTMLVTFLIASIQGYIRVNGLVYAVSGAMLGRAKLVAWVQLVTGAFIIMWIGSRNRLYGIGGQSTIIVVNIVGSLLKNVAGLEKRIIWQCFLISVPIMLIMLVMENTEKRIPVQRISIHNIYGDKNYIAIKMNPVGAMAIMFASVAFFLPRMAVGLLAVIFPERPKYQMLVFKMNLTKPLGTGVYLILLFLLTVIFSFIFINPGDLAEQLQKSGDSIIGLHPGKETKRYLFRNVLYISLFSATVISLCMSATMIPRLYGIVDDRIAMLPTSFMILAGLGCTVYQEACAVRNLDDYESFL